MAPASLLLALVAVFTRAVAESVSPNCALNGLGCPPPAWTPTYNLTRSTVIQPEGAPGSGYFTTNHTWGLISLDWTIAQGIWGAAGPSNAMCEATLRENCAALKAAGKTTRCFLYHNTELALEWLEGQRVGMYDPARASYFLQYLPGNPTNVTPGTIANDHRSQGDQFFFNFSTLHAQLFYINEVLASLADPSVDGTFTDDVDGLPAEHAGVPASLGMSSDALSDLRFATQQMGSALIYALVAAGKYTWQAFFSQDTSVPAPLPQPPAGRTPMSPSRAAAFRGPVTPSTCAQYMRTFCALGYQGRPLLQHHDASSAAMRNASVASFLITRPPIAYLGFAFASDDRDWDPLFALQVGEPTGLCAESPAGVFTRPYTLGTASLDCNSFTAHLPFDALPLA